MGRKDGRRSYVRMGRSAQSLRPPHPPSDSRRVTQGDAVRDGHGGDPSRHPGQHLATPDGPAKRKARGLRPGRGAALLLPEPSEAGGRDPRAACRGPAGHPQDEGADRPGEREGEEGTGGFPWLISPAPPFCPIPRTPWRRAGTISKKGGPPVWRSPWRGADWLSRPRYYMRRKNLIEKGRGNEACDGDLPDEPGSGVQRLPAGELQPEGRRRGEGVPPGGRGGTGPGRRAENRHPPRGRTPPARP